MKISVKHLISIFIALTALGYGITKLINWLIIEKIVPLWWTRINLIGLYGLIAVGVVILLLILFEGKMRAGIGLRRFSGGDLKFPFLALVLVFPVLFIGRLIAPSYDRWFIDMQGIYTWGGLGFFIVSILFFVFKEELIERFIQIRLSNVYGPIITIIAISINFSLLHYAPFYGEYRWILVGSVFLATLVLAALFELTHNIWLTIIFHAIFNSLSALQIFLHGRDHLLLEQIFWAAYALVFLIFFIPAARAFHPIFKKIPNILVGDWILLLIFSFGLPILFVFFLYGL